MADQIEVPAAPPMEQQSKPPAQPGGQRKPPQRVEETPDRGFLREHPIKALFGLIVLAALVIGGVLFWRYSQTYESTDDAFIDGHTNHISPRIAGTISKVLITENQFVKEGQVLGEIDPS